MKSQWHIVLKKAKKRENGRYAEKAEIKTKSMWQVINKEAGNFPSYYQKNIIKNTNRYNNKSAKVNGNVKLLFCRNCRWTDTTQHLPYKHSNTIKKIYYCPTSIFVVPITDNKVECVTKNLQGKFSAEYDKISEYVVIQCTRLIRGISTHIYNISFKSGTFLEKFKIVRVKLLYKKDIFIM